MNESEQTYHIPVLLNESIDGMNLHPAGIYADMTFGGGGHSKEILRRMDKNSHLYSFDWATVEDCLVSTRMKMPKKILSMTPDLRLCEAISDTYTTSCAIMV